MGDAHISSNDLRIGGVDGLVDGFGDFGDDVLEVGFTVGGHGDGAGAGGGGWGLGDYLVVVGDLGDLLLLLGGLNYAVVLAGVEVG